MENVVTVFPGGSTGFAGSKSFDVVLTTERLILARTSKEKQKEAFEKARSESKEKEEGFFKKVASTVKAGATMHERFVEMAPADIASENTENISIPFSAVKSIRVRNASSGRGYRSRRGLRVGMSSGGGPSLSYGSFRQLMTIKWTGKDHSRPNKATKTKLTFSNLDVRETRKILKEHLGEVAK